MAQIGNVKEINDFKETLDKLKQDGYIHQWEMPYEHVITRLEAAWFFFTPAGDSCLKNIQEGINMPDVVITSNETSSSSLQYHITFNE